MGRWRRGQEHRLAPARISAQAHASLSLISGTLSPIESTALLLGDLLVSALSLPNSSPETAASSAPTTSRPPTRCAGMHRITDR